MAEPYVAKRVFEVARDLRITTSEILDYLTSAGYDVTRKQMQPVDERMYIAIMHRFDRLKFEQHLIAHGILGEELRHMTAILDEQAKRLVKPPAKPAAAKPSETSQPSGAAPEEPSSATPKPLPGRPSRFNLKRREAPLVRRKPPLPVEVNTFRVVIAKRPEALKPRPVVPPPNILRAAEVPATIEPRSIPVTQLTLQLFKIVLAFSNDEKLRLLEELRKTGK